MTKQHEFRADRLELGGGKSMDALKLGEGDRHFVFCHGTGANPRMYEGFFRAYLRLNPDTEIDALSGPGEGNTPRLRPGEGMSDRVLQYIFERGLDGEGLILGGHSRGGLEIMHAATKLPDALAITLASPVGGMEKIRPEQLLYLLSMDMSASLFEKYDELTKNGQVAELIQLVGEVTMAGFNNMPGMLEEIIEFEKTSKLTEKLPVDEALAVFQAHHAEAFFGQKDWAFPYGRESKKLPLECVHEIPGGHHDFPISRAGETARRVSEVVKKH